MKTIAKDILEVTPVTLTQCIGFGLPLEKGLCKSPKQLQLAQNGTSLEAKFQAKNLWPDGTLRWVWCEAIVEQAGSLDVLMSASWPRESESPDRSFNHVSINNDSQRPYFASIAKVFAASSSLELDADIKFSGERLKTPISNIRLSTHSTGFYDHYTIRGDFKWQQSHLNFSCVVKVCEKTKQYIIDVSLHNPQAAEHPDGCWDLGDSGSALIEEFSLILSSKDAACIAKIKDQATGEAYQPSGDFNLTQSASGGEHWQSPIHLNSDRELSVKVNGFCLQSLSEDMISGKRAQPQLGIVKKETTLALELADFWQNFPLQLSASQGKIQWKLFSDNTELQGGEAKSWQFRLAELSPNEGTLPEALSDKFSGKVKYKSEYLDAVACLPHMSLSAGSAELEALIQNGLDGDSTFFAKRERIDVYGWRNYGDLYADHETHGLKEEPYFVSVYNNQYDPLMGMTYQYLRSGDERWLELSTALSRHLQDIDIYDTDEDKAEYNGGLFWHTNHYLKMETSTHRSYSKHHTAVYENFSAGGGPGGQHCYTTGLMLRYRLFGDDRAGRKVEQLCNWIRCFYNGNSTLLDRSFRFLTVDIKSAGFSNIGIKAPGYRYPLDRGIGNFLVALMDCYEVTNNEERLAEAAEVIRNTCHPTEDLQQRDLLDVENTWFYTVFLQAVARFIFLKHSLGQHDADFVYARDSLLHYADWMVDNDIFYLERPEVLEFPNDTWCAQDLRKATIYECAASLCSHVERRKDYDAARIKTIQYVAQKLSQSPEKEYTRILVLLMQSVYTVKQAASLPDLVKLPSSTDFGAAPVHSHAAVLKTYVGDMFKLLLKLSISKEYKWFKLRFLKKK